MLLGRLLLRIGAPVLGVIGVLWTGLAYVRYREKLQIETEAFGTVLLLFAEDKGRMPQDMEELFKTGYLDRDSRGRIWTGAQICGRQPWRYGSVPQMRFRTLGAMRVAFGGEPTKPLFWVEEDEAAQRSAKRIAELIRQAIETPNTRRDVICLYMTRGRYRVLVSKWVSRGTAPVGASPAEEIATVTLKYLPPGPRVLMARWKSPEGAPGEPSINVPGEEEVVLGTVPPSQAPNLKGTVEITLGKKWAIAKMGLSGGSRCPLPAGSALRELRMVRVAGTDSDGAPGSTFDVEGNTQERQLKAYVAEFDAFGQSWGVVPCNANECFLIDEEGAKHQALKIYVTGEKRDPARCVALFPIWKDSFRPASIELRVPVKTQCDVLRLDEMERIPP